MNHDDITRALRLAAEELANPAPPPTEVSDADRVADFQQALLAATNRGTAIPQPPDAA